VTVEFKVLVAVLMKIQVMRWHHVHWCWGSYVSVLWYHITRVLKLYICLMT